MEPVKNELAEAMTLRDQFAAAALVASQTELAAILNSSNTPSVYINNLAKFTYHVADAMLEARKS